MKTLFFVFALVLGSVCWGQQGQSVMVIKDVGQRGIVIDATSVSVVDFTDRVPIPHCAAKTEELYYKFCTRPKPPEPVDVAAIMEDYIAHKAGDLCPSGNTALCAYATDVHDKRPACADKTRGLWHDEQTPPKFYCHKPQTGEGQ